MNDVTYRYLSMIEAFDDDFQLTKDKFEGKERFVMDLPTSTRLMGDIALLNRLMYELRYGNVKIMEVDEYDKTTDRKNF